MPVAARNTCACELALNHLEVRARLRLRERLNADVCVAESCTARYDQGLRLCPRSVYVSTHYRLVLSGDFTLFPVKRLPLSLHRYGRIHDSTSLSRERYEFNSGEDGCEKVQGGRSVGYTACRTGGLTITGDWRARR